MNTNFTQSDNQNAPISFFAQILKYLPRQYVFELENKYIPKSNATKFSLWDQLIAMMFAHLAHCDSLREIEDGLFSAVGKLEHVAAKPMGRTSLAYANEHHDYNLFKMIYEHLLEKYQPQIKKLDDEYTKPVYALDSTTISVCLSRFDWAKYRQTKGAFKLHTITMDSVDLPVVMDLTEGRRGDVKQAKSAISKIGKTDITVVMDRGYNDYSLFMWLTERGTTFVTRLKEGSQTTRLTEDVIEENENYGDYGFKFSSDKAKEVCGEMRFRVVQWHDTVEDRWFDFLTNDFELTASQIAELYKRRWHIELFFKRLKQNLKVKTFIGTSKTAVMTQIWTAAIVALLIELLRRISRHKWSFSGLRKFLTLNLLTHKKLDVWIHRPDFRKIREKSPEEVVQFELNFDGKS